MVRLYAHSRSARFCVYRRHRAEVSEYPNRIAYSKHTAYTPSSYCIETVVLGEQAKPNLLLLLLLLLVGAAAAAAIFFFRSRSFVIYFSSSSSIFGFCAAAAATHGTVCPNLSDCACQLWLCAGVFIEHFCKYTLRCSVRDDEKPCLLCSTLSLSLYSCYVCAVVVVVVATAAAGVATTTPHTIHAKRSKRELAVWWSSAVTTDSVSPSWICYEIQNGGRFIFY